MLKSEIASVVWHEQGHRIEVIYVEGDPDYMQGDELVISQMAENEGLSLVATSPDIRRWVRHLTPDTPRLASPTATTPKRIVAVNGSSRR
jgi:hypothetical protein